MEKILVLNSGSSSLKYQLFNVDGDKFEVVAKGLADRIGIEGSLVTIKVGDGDQGYDRTAAADPQGSDQGSARSAARQRFEKH